MDWDDLRVFLAIARTGSLAAAGRAIGQSQPTMGRRLRALEADVGQTLFQRTADGFLLTDEGSAVLLHAERMEAEAFALAQRLAGRDGALDGTLRITASDWFAVHVLGPLLAEFASLHPGVTIETLSGARRLSLSRREADLAFRTMPFDEPEIISRRVAPVEYAAFIRAGAVHPVAGDGEGFALIGNETAFASRPEAVWIRRLLPNARIVSHTNNRELQAALCRMGLGVAVLPRPLGDAVHGIERIDLGEQPAPRYAWLGYHRDLRHSARLRALIDLVIERLAG